MLDAGRHRLDPCLLEAADNFVRPDPRGEIDVADLEAHELVAHRAAHVAGLPLVCAERIQHARCTAQPAPLGCVEPQVHCSRRARLMMIAAVAPQILRPCHGIS